VKSVGTIKHKLNQVRFRYLKKLIEAEFRPTPGNCRHNVLLPKYASLEPGSVTEHPPVGVCAYGMTDPSSGWPLSHCDERVDGGSRARSCDKFCPRRTKEEVKEDFRQKLDAMTFPEVAFNYPDMAALIWVLDTSDVSVPEDVPPPTPVVVSEEPDPPTDAGSPPAPLVEELPPSEPPRQEPPKKPWYARLLGD
jgi:hypothetical protein